MARPPTAEMAAHAVAVPMAEIMHGEMAKAVAAKIMVIAVLEATPIRSVITPAIKSATEAGAETAAPAAAAMGDGGCLRQSQSNDQEASPEDLSPKGSHGLTP
jgi:hypothetical protein